MSTIETNRQVRKQPRKFDVALSFAEENRAFVDSVATLLAEKDVDFFYDDYERVHSWGANLKLYLRKVYGKKARFCVVFISEYYMQKKWTVFELMCSKDYILPYLLDNTEIKGITDTVAYLKSCDEQELVEAIVRKLDLAASRSLRGRIKQFLSNRLRLAALIIMMGSVIAMALWDHLTPVDMLTQRLYESNSKACQCSRCNDSTLSHSTGPGTCSWHDGVAYTIDTIIHNKTLEECRKEAKRISWWPAPTP